VGITHTEPVPSVSIRSDPALAEDYLDDFRNEYPDAIAPESIPQSQDIRNAAESGQTAFALEEPSTTADRARSAYLSASEALLTRLGE
jgi:chromosome partitioning protein